MTSRSCRSTPLPNHFPSQAPLWRVCALAIVAHVAVGFAPAHAADARPQGASPASSPAASAPAASPPAASSPSASSPAAPRAAPDASPVQPAEPKVVVPAPMKGGSAVDAAAHKLLVEALRERLGSRVLEVKTVIDAQLATSITASDLVLTKSVDSPPAEPADQPPGALERLGQALGAKRAILVDVQETQTVAVVLASLQSPGLVVTVPRKKAARLDATWAKAVAAQVEKLGGGALEPELEPELEVEMAPKPAASDVRAEIEAEEARDRARGKALAAKRREQLEAQDPYILVTGGVGAAVRALEVSGSGAQALSPVQNGVVPTASLFIGVKALRLLPGLEASPWSDLVVEGSWRRGLTDVKVGGKSCPYDDDDVFARASWRFLAVDHAFMPRLGLWAGGGVERVELGCDFAVVSTRYPHLSGGARVTQPILPRSTLGPASPLELDLLAGGRAVFVDDDGNVVPSWMAEGFLAYRPIRFLVVRAGGRVTGTQVEARAQDLTFIVNDTRMSLELQLGGSF